MNIYFLHGVHLVEKKNIVKKHTTPKPEILMQDTFCFCNLNRLNTQKMLKGQHLKHLATIPTLVQKNLFEKHVLSLNLLQCQR